MLNVLTTGVSPTTTDRGLKLLMVQGTSAAAGAAVAAMVPPARPRVSAAAANFFRMVLPSGLEVRSKRAWMTARIERGGPVPGGSGPDRRCGELAPTRKTPWRRRHSGERADVILAWW